MNSSTHAAVGAATALTAVCLGHPELSIVDCTLVTAVGAFAGMLSDIDLKQSKAAYYARTLVCVAVVGALIGVVNMFCGTKVISFGLSIRVLIGTTLFVGLLIAGMKAPHREKTHSLVFLGLFTVAIKFMTGSYFCECAVCFGYFSHLLIDLPNKKGECLLWPWKKRICLNLCTSDGIVSKCLGALGTGIVVFDFAYFIA